MKKWERGDLNPRPLGPKPRIMLKSQAL